MSDRERWIAIIEGRAPQPGVSLLTLVFALAVAVRGLVKPVTAAVLTTFAGRRSRAQLEQARLEDEAFEDAARLNALREQNRVRCWCGHSAIARVPGGRMLCAKHFETWRADA